MIFKIKCPHCDENLSINIIDNKVVSVEVDGIMHLSEDCIKTILDNMGIEFGILEGGENT